MGGKQATKVERDTISREAESRALAKNPNAKNPEIVREMGQRLLGWRWAGDGAL